MKQNWYKAAALLAALALTAAACGSDSEATPTESTAAPTASTVEDDAMEDDAMEDDAMEDDAMEDDAMEDDAMESDAMAMEEGTSVLHLELSDLDPAGDGNQYQVWSVVAGESVAGGAFNIEDGEVKVLGDQDHLYAFDDVESIFITIEPETRAADDVPSSTKVLTGDVDSDGVATLTAVGNTTAAGTGEIR